MLLFFSFCHDFYPNNDDSTEWNILDAMEIIEIKSQKMKIKNDLQNANQSHLK